MKTNCPQAGGTCREEGAFIRFIPSPVSGRLRPAPANQQETREPAPAVSSSQAVVSAPEPEKPADPEQLSNRAEQAESEELSGEAPARYFQLTYDGSKAYVGGLSTEEAVDWELDVLNIKAQNENQRLPDDCRDQYRAWWPVDEASASTAQQTKPSTQTQPTTPQPSGGKAIYGGYNTYDEYINAMHSKFPEATIEEIKDAFPDQATAEAPAAAGDIRDGRLSGS